MQKSSIYLLTSLLIAIVSVSAIAGTIIFYNNEISSKNSKIDSLTGQVNSLQNQVATLKQEISALNSTAQATNSTEANLVPALTITEKTDTPYNHLDIVGGVDNNGTGTAYNAGLKVVAYTADGTLAINMTSPLNDDAVFGTDSQTSSYLVNTYSVNISTQLTSLYAGFNATVYIGIYHEGTVSNWTVTPVWTNSP